MGLFLHYLSLPYLRQGIVFTLEVTGLGLAGGLLVGLVLAGMQLSRFRLLSGFARAYAVIFRGTPLILQLVFAYDALPHIGLKLTSVAAAGLALAANEGPFIAEILRAGVLGVEPGQIAAGQALGMTPLVLMRRVIAPQAIRTMVPGLGSEAVSALKNSSLASVIAVEELTLRSTQLASSTFDFFSIFFASGVMYLALTGAVSALQLTIEAMLDLDRPKPRDFLRRILPWYRPHVSAAPQAGRPEAAAIFSPFAEPSRSTEDRRCNSGAEGRSIRRPRLRAGQGGGAQPVQTIRGPCRLQPTRPHRAIWRGDRAARSQRGGKKHAAALHQPVGGMGYRDSAGSRAPPWL